MPPDNDKALKSKWSKWSKMCTAIATQYIQ